MSVADSRIEHRPFFGVTDNRRNPDSHKVIVVSIFILAASSYLPPVASLPMRPQDRHDLLESPARKVTLFLSSCHGGVPFIRNAVGQIAEITADRIHCETK